MPDDTDTGGAQGAQQGEPQGGSPPAQGAGAAAAQGASSANGGDDREALLARIAALEKDNRDYREERRKASAKKDPGPDEGTTVRLAELERELSDMKVQRQEQSLRLLSITAAQKLGYRNPDLAYRLLDTASVDYADDGTPRNVERLLTDLAKAEPYLLTSTDFGGGPRGSAPGDKADMNTLIRQAAGRR